MDKSKTLHASKAVTFSSLQVLSIAVCFVPLIHVQIKLYAHDQMLRALLEQKEENSDTARRIRGWKYNLKVKRMKNILKKV